MNRKESLDAAAGCVLVDRNKHYGDPEDNFRTTAQIMSAYLKGRGLLSGDLAPHDVAALMISLKLARLCTSPAKEDTWVDLIGYGACGVECATAAYPRDALPTMADMAGRIDRILRDV